MEHRRIIAASSFDIGVGAYHAKGDARYKRYSPIWGYFYFDDNGFLWKEEPGELTEEQIAEAAVTAEAFLQELENFGYNPRFNYWMFCETLEKLVGKHETEVVKYFRKRAALNQKSYEERIYGRERDPFNPMFDKGVIGMGRKINKNPTGFSVRVLFKEGDYAERKKFVYENQKEFLITAMKAISVKKGMLRSIGDIRFYKPVEITVLKDVPEVEIQFEVKTALDDTSRQQKGGDTP